MRCVVGAHGCTSAGPLLARRTVTKIGWPMDRARSVFETPARFGRATLQWLNSTRTIGSNGMASICSSAPFPFGQLDRGCSRDSGLHAWAGDGGSSPCRRAGVISADHTHHTARGQRPFRLRVQFAQFMPGLPATLVP